MRSNLAEFSVIEFSRAVKSILEDSFGYVRITGEVIGSKLASSGHFYFNLREDKASLAAVCFRNDFSKIDFEIADGMQISAMGKITTFEGRSNYQIIVENVEVAGLGAILAMLQKRKEKLEKEGLFAFEHKKQLPFLPKIIGVISSKTGAVIEDIKHRINARYPCFIKLFNAQMQGKNAATEVISGIRYFNQMKENRPDILIIARGGGSFEDLLPFSDEKLVREAFKSKIPLISAIGHETDNCLLDLVADLRAPTPTAAAEIATPNLFDIVLHFKNLTEKLFGICAARLEAEELQLKNLQKFLRDPQKILASYQEEILANFEQIRFRCALNLNFKEQNLRQFAFPRQIFYQKIETMQKKSQLLFELITQRTISALDSKEKLLNAIAKNLVASSHEEILRRGFAIIKAENGDFITSSQKAITTNRLEIELADGSFVAFPYNPMAPTLFH